MVTQILPEQLLNWRSLPTTQLVLQYLSDYRDALAGRIKDALLNEQVPDQETMREVAIICQTLKDIFELTPEDINQFYNPKTEDTNDQTEDPGADISPDNEVQA